MIKFLNEKKIENKNKNKIEIDYIYAYHWGQSQNTNNIKYNDKGKYIIKQDNALLSVILINANQIMNF